MNPTDTRKVLYVRAFWFVLFVITFIYRYVRGDFIISGVITYTDPDYSFKWTLFFIATIMLYVLDYLLSRKQAMYYYSWLSIAADVVAWFLLLYQMFWAPPDYGHGPLWPPQW